MVSRQSIDLRFVTCLLATAFWKVSIIGLVRDKETATTKLL